MSPVSKSRVVPLFAAASLILGQPAVAGAPVGAPAPPLVATAIDGRPVDLAQLHGHVVVVHFWATWCPPCREEMPVLDAFYRAHRGEGLEIIAASIDRKRDLSDVRKAMKDFAFPAVLVAEAKANGWGTPDAMPLTYVIDATGVIRSVVRPGKGTLTAEQLAAQVGSLLPKASGPDGTSP
jgi:cytochrome c biogenesis protein CcmG, thiol:disulfide interchange protein DsbE